MKLKPFLLLLGFTCLTMFNASAQSYATNKKVVDSIKAILLKTKSDTAKVNTLLALGQSYDLKDRDHAMHYAKQALTLSEKAKYRLGEARAHFDYAMALKGLSYFGPRGDANEVNYHFKQAISIFKSLGQESELADSYRQYAYFLNWKNDFNNSYKYKLMALKIYEKLGDKLNMAGIYGDLAGSFADDDSAPEQLKNFKNALAIYLQLNKLSAAANYMISIGTWYLENKEYKEALKFCRQALAIYEKLGSESPDYGVPWAKGNVAQVYLEMAESKMAKANPEEARANLRMALPLLNSRMSLETAGKMDHRQTYPQLGQCFLLLAKLDKGVESRNHLFESLKNYESSVKNAGENNETRLLDTYAGLSEVNGLLGNYKNAYHNLALHNQYKDSLEIRSNETQQLKMKMQYDFDKVNEKARTNQEKKDAETKRARSRQLFVIFILSLVALAIIIIAFILHKNNKQKQVANLNLQQQKEKVEATLSELKTTQSQLIQSEKMASLGELTAGIAHEIQNPLNFVNNFSDVSIELLSEMTEELDKGDIVEAKEIASDIKQNLEKIAHHGRRADSIVKGMLQHSRKSSGEKEPTDINALADEYLRLAYHGLRAKDKSFNSELILNLDPNLPKINVFTQDIGRVLLNLFTNSFYATQQKSKNSDGTYQPIVKVTTQTTENSIEISVADNGIGIPETIRDKILQPFFTTKPTGEGTGLGLSLSYDILVKVHGGTINIESIEGEYTIFTVRLPIES